MNQTMKFNYFYGAEAEQYSFYRIPKPLVTNDYFKGLSSDAKILYGLMLDRMALSIKNQWFDEENRAYIYFSIDDIVELMNCGKTKAVKVLQELDDVHGIGLIEKRRQGLGKTNIIYVKSFMAVENAESENQKSMDECSSEQNQEISAQAEQTPVSAQNSGNETSANSGNVTEFHNTVFLNTAKQNSRMPQNEIQEYRIPASNYNKYNNTKENETESNLIVSADVDSDEMEKITAYEELIAENIDLQSLLTAHPYDRDVIQGIYALILDTVLCASDRILIASSWYPAELVRSRFLKLNYSHIEYVLECLHKTTAKVQNIKKYLMAALFNAPTTMGGYYQAEVNHDMRACVE